MYLTRDMVLKYFPGNNKINLQKANRMGYDKNPHRKIVNIYFFLRGFCLGGEVSETESEHMTNITERMNYECMGRSPDMKWGNSSLGYNMIYTNE